MPFVVGVVVGLVVVRFFLRDVLFCSLVGYMILCLVSLLSSFSPLFFFGCVPLVARATLLGFL